MDTENKDIELTESFKPKKEKKISKRKQKKLDKKLKKKNKKKAKKMKKQAKKYNRKQKKIDKKQAKLDKKKSSCKKLTKHKTKKFDKKQRKIDRKQRRNNKLGVKAGVLPADILPEKKFNDFKGFCDYIHDKLYIENKKTRIFVKIVAVIATVAIVIGIISGAASSSAEKKWIAETNQKIEDINYKVNTIVIAYGGEPTGETDIQSIQRKLDTIIKLLENKSYTKVDAAQVDEQLEDIEGEIDDIDIGTDEPAQPQQAQSAGKTNTSAKKTSSVPSTKKEIIEYCNKALNRIKSEKAGYNKHYVMTVKGDVGHLPSWLVNLAKTDETTEVKKGMDSKDIYPAIGYTWSSKLTEDDVKTATLKQSGSKYIIKLTIVEENNPKKGNSHFGRCMSVLEESDVLSKSSLLKSADMHYYNGYIYAEIDSKTGHVIKSEASATADVKLNVAVLGDVSAKQVVSTETFTNFVW